MAVYNSSQYLPEKLDVLNKWMCPLPLKFLVIEVAFNSKTFAAEYF